MHTSHMPSHSMLGGLTPWLTWCWPHQGILATRVFSPTTMIHAVQFHQDIIEQQCCLAVLQVKCLPSIGLIVNHSNHIVKPLHNLMNLEIQLQDAFFLMTTIQRSCLEYTASVNISGSPMKDLKWFAMAAGIVENKAFSRYPRNRPRNPKEREGEC